MRKYAKGALAVAALFPGCGMATPTIAQTEQNDTVTTPETSLAGQRYVAMGSSFAAGPMLPPPKSGAPVRCGQSQSNYPTLLAQRFGMILTDRSCSGATTDHILGPWNDIAPQISAVTPQTRLVTITIGGNDLNYIGNLFNATCAYRARSVAAAGGKPQSCAPVKIPTEFDYSRDEMQMMEIARRIRAIAPKARIVFVQYLMPVPVSGGLCPATPISEEHAAIVREIGRRLGEITDRVASANGALAVQMNVASAGHSPCDAVPWMIGSPEGYNGKDGLQWHLNRAGMEATANDIAWWLTQNGYTQTSPAIIVAPQIAPAPAPAPFIAPPPPPPARRP